MAEYSIEIGNNDLLVEYTYIPEQKERYPDTEPLRAHVEIDRIFYNDTEVTELMYEVADDWLIHLETEIIEKLEN
jgi:hypothetical protein|tara:strand:+ start:737 stop:961 length:225 start_codon:yes stop_codon:yes gene_type:complete